MPKPTHVVKYLFLAKEEMFFYKKITDMVFDEKNKYKYYSQIENTDLFKDAVEINKNTLSSLMIGYNKLANAWFKSNNEDEKLDRIYNQCASLRETMDANFKKFIKSLQEAIEKKGKDQLPAIRTALSQASFFQSNLDKLGETNSLAVYTGNPTTDAGKNDKNRRRLKFAKLILTKRKDWYGEYATLQNKALSALKTQDIDNTDITKSDKIIKDQMKIYHVDLENYYKEINKIFDLFLNPLFDIDNDAKRIEEFASKV